MENKEEKIERRKKAIKEWLGNRHNQILVGILLLALIIRLYFFILTNGQPLWWDEAEYLLKAKNLAFGTPETGWAGHLRPILFPAIASVFLKVGLGESFLRFILVLISLGGILLIFLIGKELFNERVGLFAAFIMSVFYLDLFYTSRLLVDVPQVFFVLLAVFLFVKHQFGGGSRKLIWFILPVLFVGTMVRFTVGVFILVILFFLIITKGLKLLKEKDWYISAGLGILSFTPYLIYSTVKFGHPLFTIISILSKGTTTRNEGVTGFDIFMEYVNYFPNYMHLFFFILFLVGLAFALFSLSLRIDRLTRDKEGQKYLFLLLWILIPVVYFGFLVNHFEDRYIFKIFPAVFFLAGLGLDKLYLLVKKHGKNLALVAVLFILIFGGYNMFTRGTELIKSKVSSYDTLRDAGLWIKENSNPEDIVLNMGRPQNTYYSERTTIRIPDTEEDFVAYITENRPRYVVLSVWERHPAWLNDWPQENPELIAPVKAFFQDAQQQQPTAVIYEFKY